MQVKRILVTGGAGFLGSHLCRRLMEQGHTVICLDNFHTGRFEHIESLADRENFQLILHDVVEPLDIRVDEIYNLACPASPVHYQADPIHTVKTLIYGALNMLELALRCNARIFLSSTSEVYGNPHEHPQKESYFGNVNPHGVRSCYDEGKRCAETLFFDYHRRYRLEIKVARIFNTYGPNMNPQDGRVVSNFIVQALRDRPISVYGDGSQTRSFCYVEDMISGIMRLMESPPSVTGPVNLGNPSEITVMELARKVLQITGTQSPVEIHPLPADDPVKRKPDISMARRTLDWHPQVPLEEGLNHTIAYFRKILQSETVAARRRKRTASGRKIKREAVA